MFRKFKDSVTSQLPFSRPSDVAPSRPSESYEDFIERIRTLFEESEDAEEFFDALESAPAHWRRKPELMMIKATALLRVGDADEAKKIISEIERTHPRFPAVHYYKAIMYMQDLFLAHALRAFDRFRNTAEIDSETESDISGIEKAARLSVEKLATELGISFEKAEKASWYNEAAQEKLAEGQWQAAEQNAREATRVAPNWTSPRNNRAYVLYFMGKVKEAFIEAQAVLQLDPHNMHALKNLAIFHTGLGEDEKAREYALQAAATLDDIPLEATEADTVIAVLGLVKEHETLWKLAQKYLKRDADDLIESSWYSLGVAALHQGRRKEAQKLLEKVQFIYEPALELATNLRKSKKTGTPPPATPDYPDAAMLLHSSIMEELIGIISKHKGDGDLPPYLQKKLNEFIEKRPFVIAALLRMLTMPHAAEILPSMLLSFNRPDVEARLRDFGLGNVGTNGQRLQALMALSRAGKELPPSPVRFWNDETGDWIETALVFQMITNDVELNISPAASVWAEKAHRTDDVEEKISFFRKAVAADPKSGYAVHMLGVLLINNKQLEEGLPLARRAIEVDPDYMFAYANLARMEMYEEKPDLEMVESYLQKLSKAPVLTSQTAFYMRFTSMALAFERQDFKAAQKEFDIASEMRPDDPLLEGWEVRINLGETFGDGGFLGKYHKEAKQRSHKKAMQFKLEADSDSSVTLNSLTRDTLPVTAKIWGASPYGKKAALVENISKRMQDLVVVKHVFGKFSDEEKNALQWVLETNGARSWNEFTEKFGNDLEESPHWNYHEPETIMGRLRQTGLLAKGTLNGEAVIFIPSDARHALNSFLGNSIYV